MIFSLCYTSRRPGRIREIINEWLRKAQLPELVEIILSVDADDADSIKVGRELEGQTPNFKFIVQDSLPGDCVKGWNLAGTLASGKVLLAIADDFSPPKGWDALLLSASHPGWINEDWAVHVSDGNNTHIATLAVVTKLRYERFGYIFYPEYRSMFSDTELTEKANLEGRMVDARHLLFEHEHPDNGKRTRDEIDLAHASNARWKHGESLFNARQSLGFPTDVGPNAGKADIYHGATERTEYKFIYAEKYAAYIQATKDDFCLAEVCLRLMEEGVQQFFFCIPDEYWSGKHTAAEEIQQVREVSEFLAKKGAITHVRMFNVSRYRLSGRNRIEVETQVRNESLRWIRNEGFKHILIVDGDELWLKGLLGVVDRLVVQAMPGAVGCRMIPVVGLPGYPIDQAQDLVTVYIGKDAEFSSCRTPNCKNNILDIHGVVHFTATRKTMADIIQKHRESGHYDDPNYDFEGWISNTLPNIKPGFRNCHMYKPHQIWPIAREWYPSEIPQIPTSLHKYLGINGQLDQVVDTTQRPLTQQTTPKISPVKINAHRGYVSKNPYRIVPL
jgi:hypothetical protein